MSTALTPPAAETIATKVDADSAGTIAERPLGPALRRGWRRRCPQCGSGPMLSGYLKVREACPVCGLDLTPQRADDGPAYLTILIVGHIMAPVFLFAFTRWRPEPLVLATVFSVGTVGLSLYLLPRLKGALVALQWAKCMHGFDTNAQRPRPQGAEAGDDDAH